jgi:hypothetical protein
MRRFAWLIESRCRFLALLGMTPREAKANAGILRFAQDDGNSKGKYRGLSASPALRFGFGRDDGQ